MSDARDELTRPGPAFRRVYRPHFEVCLATLVGVDRVRAKRPGFWNRIQSEFGDWLASVSEADLRLLGDVERTLKLQAALHAVDNASQMNKRPWPGPDCPRRYDQWSAWYGGADRQYSADRMRRHLGECEDCARIAELVPRDLQEPVSIPIQHRKGGARRSADATVARSPDRRRRSGRQTRERQREHVAAARRWLSAQNRLRWMLGGVLALCLVVLATVWQHFFGDRDPAKATGGGPTPAAQVGEGEPGDGAPPQPAPEDPLDDPAPEGPDDDTPDDDTPFEGLEPSDPEGSPPVEALPDDPENKPADDPADDPSPTEGDPRDDPTTPPPEGSPDSGEGEELAADPEESSRPESGAGSPWTLRFLGRGAPTLTEGREGLVLNRRRYPELEFAELGLPAMVDDARVLPAGRELVEEGGEFWHRYTWADGRALFVAYDVLGDEARTHGLALQNWTPSPTRMERRVMTPEQVRRELGSFRPEQRVEVLRGGRVVAFAVCATEEGSLTVPTDPEQPLLYRLVDGDGRGTALELEPRSTSHALIHNDRERPGPSDPRLRRLLQDPPRLVDEVRGTALPGTAHAVVDPATGLARELLPSEGSAAYHPIPARALDRLAAGEALAFRPRLLRCVAGAVDAPTGLPIPDPRLEVVGAVAVGDDRLMLPPPPQSLDTIRVRLHAPGYLGADLSLREAVAAAAGPPLELSRTHRNLVLAFPDSRELRNVLPRPPLESLPRLLRALRDELRTRVAPLGYEEIELWMVSENSARPLDDAALRGDLGASFLAADKPEALLARGPLPSGEYSIYDDPELRERFGPHTAVLALLGDFFPPAQASVRAPTDRIGHLHLLKLRADFDEPTWTWCVNNSDSQSSLALLAEDEIDLEAAARTVAEQVAEALRVRWNTPPR